VRLFAGFLGYVRGNMDELKSKLRSILYEMEGRSKAAPFTSSSDELFDEILRRIHLRIDAVKRDKAIIKKLKRENEALRQVDLVSLIQSRIENHE
jgi:hypothetical protein